MTSTGRILVVDDDDAGRSAKADILRDAGYAVDEVSTGQAALDRAAGGDYALVLLAVRLPDISGVEVCRRLKISLPTIFVLQTSATVTDARDRVRSLDNGADAYLVESMEPSELLAIARSLLRLQRAETALRDSEARLQLAQEVAGLAVIDWDISRGLVVCSDNFDEIFGRDTVGASVGTMRDILTCVHPEDRAALEMRFSDLRSAGGPFDLEFRIVASDGRIAWIASRGQFLQDGGLTVRMLCVNYDVTPRRRSEQMNGQLAAIVASSPDAIVSLDAQDRVLTWNAGAEKLFGRPAAEAIGAVASTMIPAEHVNERAQAMARLQAGGDIEYETVRRHAADGAPVDVWVRGAPTRAADGTIVGASLIIRDVSAHRRREDHVKFLLRELTHRSKNLLAVIQAMARQSLNRLGSPEEFVTHFSERLAGLAGSHDLLSSDNFRGASLVQLIRSQLRHYGELVGERIVLHGEDLFVKPEAAQNVGIALHELSTNAAKYGALSTPNGTISIDWTVSPLADGVRRFRLHWRETGGPPVVPPTRKGFGHVVMDRITGQALSGRSQAMFEPDGVQWMLDAPADNVVSTRVEP